jgi:polyhydroxyalkanoate synthesis regulator phasin
MKQNLKQLLKLAEKVTSAVESRVKKEADALVKSGIISRTDGKKLLNAALREAQAERKRVQSFITAELRRELAKAKPKVRQILAKKKKQFESYRKRRK